MIFINNKKFSFICLLFILVFVSPAFASSTLVHDYDDIGFTYACSYYKIVNDDDKDLSAITTKAISIDRYSKVVGDLSNGKWEFKVSQTFYEYEKVFKPCFYETNSTPFEARCFDHYESVPYQKDVWINKNIVSDSKANVKAGEYLQARFCADITRVRTSKGYEISVDHVPKYNSVTYDKLSWWNQTFLYCKNLGVVDPQADYPAWINVTYDSDMNTDFSDIRFLNQSCGVNTSLGEMGHFLRNYTLGEYADYDLLLDGTQNISMYFGAAGASSTSNITAVWGGGMVLYSVHDEGFAGITSNLAEPSRNGTLDGTHWTNDQPGIESYRGFSAIYFGRAQTDWCSWGDSDVTRANNEITITAWVNSTGCAGTSEYHIVSKGSSGSNAEWVWGLIGDGAGNCVLRSDVRGGSFCGAVLSTDIVEKDVYQMVTFIYNSTHMKNYINDTEVANKQCDKNLDDSNANMYEGAFTQSANNFDGRIDEVKIWDIALPQATLSNYFTTTEPTFEFGAKQVNTFPTEIEEQWNQTVLEGQNAIFLFKVMFNGNLSGISCVADNCTNPKNIFGTLMWNNTVYEPTTTYTTWYNSTVGIENYDLRNYTFNYTLPIAEFSNVNYTQNVTFYWNYSLINLTDYNSTNHSQRLDEMFLGTCGNLTNTSALILTFYDEKIPTNTVQTDLDIYFKIWLAGNNTTFNEYNFTDSANTTYEYCLYPNNNYRIDSHIDYRNDTAGFNQRSYFLTNASITNTTSNIFLYHLINTSASIVSFTLNNEFNDDIVRDAVIIAQRWYPELNSFLTVAMGRTGADGISPIRLELFNAWYKFQIKINGDVVRTYDKQLLDTTAVTLQLTQDPLSPYWATYKDVTASCSVSNTTGAAPNKTISCIGTDTSGLVQRWRLNVYRRDAVSWTLLDSSTTASASATMTYNLGNTTGELYWYSFDFASSPPITMISNYFDNRGSTQTYLGYGLLMMFALLLGLGLTGTWNPAVTISLAVLGIVGTLWAGFIPATLESAVISMVLLGGLVVLVLKA